MRTFDRVAGLPLQIESYGLEGLEYRVSQDFERLSTVIRLRGRDQEGIGEDVTYEGLDQLALRDAGAVHDFSSVTTLGEFCDLTADLDLFGSEPAREVSRLFRRWAFESAALDLALRQAGESLAGRLGREPGPVTFVASMRLTAPGGDEPSSIRPLRRKLDAYPGLRFKLDPTNDWTRELVGELVATGAVDSLDLKGFYSGTVVEVETDPALYRMVLEAFPEAWIEDPDVNDETRPILEPHRDRITWDAPIHSIADITDRPWPPRMVNLKPSRLGGVESLFDTYDYCEANRIGAYGGGQWELGPGRGQIQYLASIFHPDTPNDTAPSGYNHPEPPPGLPSSPLGPRIEPTGFRWGQ